MISHCLCKRAGTRARRRRETHLAPLPTANLSSLGLHCTLVAARLMRKSTSAGFHPSAVLVHTYAFRSCEHVTIRFVWGAHEMAVMSLSCCSGQLCSRDSCCGGLHRTAQLRVSERILKGRGSTHVRERVGQGPLVPLLGVHLRFVRVGRDGHFWYVSAVTPPILRKRSEQTANLLARLPATADLQVDARGRTGTVRAKGDARQGAQRELVDFWSRHCRSNCIGLGAR